MESPFNKNFFSQNRTELRKRCIETSLFVFTANGLLQRGAEMAFTFAQDANFWYLTGIEDPDVLLIMDGDEEYLLMPARDTIRETFDGVLEVDSAQSVSGISNILVGKEGEDLLDSLLAATRSVATIEPAPAYLEHFGVYSNPARAQLQMRMRKISKNINVIDVSKHLRTMRCVKQEPEIQAIQKAIDITNKAISDAMKPSTRKTYTYENEIEGELTCSFRRLGAAGHAFDPIVAGGKRACTMHYFANDHRLNRDELIVFDVGAEYNHYAADIARTFSFSPPSKRQKEVHAAVIDAQQYAFKLLKPGVILREYEKEMEKFLGSQLNKLGVINSMERNDIRKYFPHATSHFLGLYAHDTGDHDAPLEPGMVLAVEPGIYIPEESLGVRIEDNVLITENGIDILSNSLSRALY